MKAFILTCLVLFVLMLSGCKKDEKNNIVVPAGSVDALAQAIEDAGDGGTVILASGNHNESSSVTVSSNVCIKGETGAILIVDTKPVASIDENLDPALFVLGSNGFCIENVEFLPADTIGGVGIYLENSPNSLIRNCKFTKHQFSIMLQNSDKTKVENNIVEAALASIPVGSYGLIVVNGKGVEIRNNKFSKGLFGAWLCDEDGIFEDNQCFSNHIGVIPCAVPDSSLAAPRASSFVYTMAPPINWIIRNNECKNNLWFGILLFDGASECLVEDNDCSGNGIGSPWGEVDIELGKDWAVQPVFGIPVSITRNNTVKAGNYPNVRIKDCGENGTNTITGGIAIDPNVEPCF